MTGHVISGANSSIHLKKEATFKVDPSVGTAQLGYGQKLSAHERNNNLIRVWGLGSRKQQYSLEGLFSGSFSMDFLLSNPWIFKAVLGACADGGSGPSSYTHTFTEIDTPLPTYTFKNSQNFDPSGNNDAILLMLGSTNTDFSMSLSVGEPVSVSTSWIYANETFSTGTHVAQTPESYAPFAFQHGVLTNPLGITAANVQSLDITLTQNADMVSGLGNRKSTEKLEKNREYTISATIAISDPAAFWRLFYDGTASGTTPVDGATPIAGGTITLTLQNASQIMVMTFTDVKINTDSIPQDVTTMTVESVSMMAHGLVVLTMDSTQNIPADW